MSDIGDVAQETEPGLSMQAVFADAVLASKRLLDLADRAQSTMLDAIVASNTGGKLMSRAELADSLVSINSLIALGAGYATLATAVSNGPPGSRF